ncbi:MAG: pantoate--beta-alanine ligase, partial [Phycisphaerae bacterium]|nr:pantoate--beta-alanine ligase [Phycisphaerae bacterium]
EQCGYTVVSIFVNPTQFGPNEDYRRYPRKEGADLAACQKAGVDAVFLPSVQEMYPAGALATVTVGRLGEVLCGRRRAGHFDCVATVVAKLFLIVAPDKAFFGAKDYQQTVVVRRMVADLNFPLEVVVCPTVREADGLAMSSRNSYLSADERRQAAALSQALALGRDMIVKRHSPSAEVIAAMGEHLARAAPDGRTDYVQIVDPQELSEVAATDRPVLVALAVTFGDTRLIDNVLVPPRG